MIVRTGDVVHDLNRLHFSTPHWPEGWQPDITAYRYDDRIEVWVDLAGVDKSDISVDVLPDRVRIAGERRPPIQARDMSSQCRQVLTMEIECGRFSREIALPAEVNRHRVSARHENGLLWIILPLA
ncbi:MAG: Hsp20/alpha crystallin family protein [Verrucomicrobia bacterium]|nr:Hsp20/alpha crystallin family protein [Verrucomicrobiota bacterium]